MHHLAEGIQKFRQQIFPEKRELFERLQGGQSPSTLFITCSDSRIDPNLLTQSDPDELFVLRNLGNIIPPADSAARDTEAAIIEYALAVLGVPQIILCGHSDCAAVKHILHHPEPDSKIPAVSKWLEHAKEIRTVLEDSNSNKTDIVDLAIHTKVRLQLKHLQSIPVVQLALNQGKLQLHGWVYHVGAGVVENIELKAL